MATVLENFNPLLVKGSAEHPWDEWLNGKAWLLKKGEDYTCTTRSFIGNARGVAKTRGLTVSALTYIDPATNLKVEDAVVIICNGRVRCAHCRAKNSTAIDDGKGSKACSVCGKPW